MKSLKILLSLIAVTVSLLVVAPKTALASSFYQTTKGGSCNVGDLKVDSPPYKSGSTLFYCVSGLDTKTEVTSAPKNSAGKQVCPAGVAGINGGGFGLLCITNPQNVTTTAAPAKTGDFNNTKYTCGAPDQEVHVSIDLGCRHQGNPILDGLFAIIRFLSIGVGLVIIASIIVAGIQYTVSRGDPQATANALGRVRETVIALIVFIFAYAIINYLIPAGLLR